MYSMQPKNWNTRKHEARQSDWRGVDKGCTRKVELVEIGARNASERRKWSREETERKEVENDKDRGRGQKGIGEKKIKS